MYNIKNFKNNSAIRILEERKAYSVIEYVRDLSVGPSNAQMVYFANEMNIRKRQLVIELNQSKVVTQAGSMQWLVGDIKATTGIKGVGDFLGKALKSTVTKESAIKPEYVGTGTLVLEPTYKHLILVDLEEFNNSLVLEDGLFLACDGHLQHKIVSRSNFSSAMLGNEGLFNLNIRGSGIVCLESSVPMEELIIIELNNDELKIDGSMAIAWTEGLSFTVERSGKSLIGSAASGEGLVNVYRGSGKVIMAPVDYMK